MEFIRNKQTYIIKMIRKDIITKQLKLLIKKERVTAEQLFPD